MKICRLHAQNGSQSPEEREVISRDLATGEIAVLSLEAVRQEAHNYSKILHSIRS